MAKAVRRVYDWINWIYRYTELDIRWTPNRKRPDIRSIPDCNKLFVHEENSLKSTAPGKKQIVVNSAPKKTKQI